MPKTSPASRPMTPLEWVMLLALSLVWGGSFFFNGIAVQELPVFTVVVCRVVLAAIILLAVLRIRGERMPRDRRIWAAFLGMGVLNNVIPFSLIVWAQQHIASGVASILNASTPLFTVILAHLLTSDERMTGGKLIGVLIGFAGVAVMIGTDALRNLGVHVTAQLACLGAALSYAFAGLYGRRFRAMGISPICTATGQVVASSMILLPPMVASGPIMEASVPKPGRRQRSDRSGGNFNGICLCPVFSHPCHGRGNQPASGDIPDPSQRDHAWHAVPERSLAASPLCRHGPDRSRTGCH